MAGKKKQQVLIFNSRETKKKDSDIKIDSEYINKRKSFLPECPRKRRKKQWASGGIAVGVKREREREEKVSGTAQLFAGPSGWRHTARVEKTRLLTSGGSIAVLIRERPSHFPSRWTPSNTQGEKERERETESCCSFSQKLLSILACDHLVSYVLLKFI